ncbi:MAG: hypothetical protein J1E16_00095 [Muribaculaceae bacterium]|nr:hypothetical protein [Muribaculaceae bacterium]
MKTISSIFFLLFPIAIIAQETAPIKEVEQVSSDNGFWTAGPIIGIALAAVACIVAVFVIIKTENLKKELSVLKNSFKNDLKKSNEATLNKNNSEFKKLELKISELQTTIDELKTKLSSNINKISPIIENTYSSISENKKQPVESKEVDTETKKESGINRVIYFGPPRGNKFSGGRSSFTPGQSIYSINDNGKGAVEFSFSDRKEALSVALRSVTDYIESACIIVGNPSSSPTKAVTIKPGIVKREGNDWIIENKVQINLI